MCLWNVNAIGMVLFLLVVDTKGLSQQTFSKVINNGAIEFKCRFSVHCKICVCKLTINMVKETVRCTIKTTVYYGQA